MDDSTYWSTILHFKKQCGRTQDQLNKGRLHYFTFQAGHHDVALLESLSFLDVKFLATLYLKNGSTAKEFLPQKTLFYYFLDKNRNLLLTW